MDFLKVALRSSKRGGQEIYPVFITKKSKDLMIRGSDFYAIWDERKQVWSQNQDDVIDMIDDELDNFKKQNPALKDASVLYMWNADSGVIDKWRKFCQKQMQDNYHNLDEKLIFANTDVKREDYSSKRLPYALEEGDYSAWDELVGTLYSEEERHKIEWAIGAVVSGDSKTLQKFLVFYGSAGTGKSTILNVIQELFDGYWTVFDAKALASSTDAFALEAFKKNPLVAIQHDGDLSKIEVNTRLNSLVSHEEMTVNEKFKSQYSTRFSTMLFMGTNNPVRITDSKSGILRRLIDVSPTEKKIPFRRYQSLMKKIKFELGAIAYHCLQVYEEDPLCYENYIPRTMLGDTNDFYNFMEENFVEFRKTDGVTLQQAWAKYKEFCEEAKVPYPYSKRLFKSELRNYFREFTERARDTDGNQVWNYYSGLKLSKFGIEEEKHDISGTDGDGSADGASSESVVEDGTWLQFAAQKSVFDIQMASAPAQYAREDSEAPWKKWDEVKTVLGQLDTSKLHYVRVPENHIVIDFDLKDESGEKSLEKNIEAASHWPPTYAELSKSGKGIHLHYIYTGGDPDRLSRIYEDGIEVKVFTGKSSLRRKLTLCTSLAIATISSGLPFKVETKMVNFDSIKNEKAIRTLIRRSLAKEYAPHATVTSCEFINKILNDAYESGMHYDVRDLRPYVLTFASKSSHHASDCIAMVNQMPFQSEEPSEYVEADNDIIVFFDCEVFPNLFMICWKKAGEGNPTIRMINPSANDVEQLMRFKLIGFNCRKYDNHLLYARLLGYNNQQLFELSKKMILEKDNRNVFFGEAYNISYTDVLDFASKKQSLKKWEIELKIHHQELGLPWNQPAPEDLWDKIADYCCWDVAATEAVFNHLKGDYTARLILADLANGCPNDTTNTLAGKFIFGNEKHPQLVYTHLEEIFPGYSYVVDENNKAHNMYRGEDVGFGGYVFSKPGMYGRTVVLDVSGMHPASIRAMNYFGDYTFRFGEIVDLRLAIKHKDFERARQMLGGAVAKYLDDESTAKALSNALKIVVNSCYGQTSAKYENIMRDERNVNNIVALRGALFMVTLRDEVLKRGYEVISIKTDSIKIVGADDTIIEYVKNFGKQYGYSFEIENIFEKICLVNDSTFIAKCAEDDPDMPGAWYAKAAQFQVPYVFKTLFSHEPIVFDDLCETKEVKTALYLDMNEGRALTALEEKELVALDKLLHVDEFSEKSWKTLMKRYGYSSVEEAEERYSFLLNKQENSHDYHFVGKVGLFCPVKPGAGGGLLMRETDNGYAAATGTKGYRWMEAEIVQTLGKEQDIDRSYYRAMVDDAIAAISKYGDFEAFAS